MVELLLALILLFMIEWRLGLVRKLRIRFRRWRRVRGSK